MREHLSEGEWVSALEKGVSMIESSKKIKKPVSIKIRIERVVNNYFRNLVKMSPFERSRTVNQIDIRLKHVGFWIDHMGRVRRDDGSRYGCNR